ncbi:helix-turn-helix transcriptional regulator [Veillonella sp.]|uniref:helix-turn-helix domain-containing protein n=1 Tax=Veillonella sp. TaxID=1926307 RepID=UPI0025E3C57C|nr:helix-turn-helix transcriptional regulator [Veillonella sp.]
MSIIGTTLKSRIQYLAKTKGLSLTKVEEQLGFGNGTITKWDKSSPSIDKLRQVAELLNVSVDFLLGDVFYNNSPERYPYKENQGYYDDPEVAQLANEIKNDPELRILLDAKRSLSKEDMESVINITKSLLKKERGFED